MAETETISYIFQQWRDFGVFAYLGPYIIFSLIFFLISFYLINKTKFLENNNAIKSLINIIISGFIATILSLISIQFDYVPLLFAIAESIGMMILGLIILSSLILWIWALIDIIRKSDEKAIWILNLIIGNMLGGWAYLLSKKVNLGV